MKRHTVYRIVSTILPLLLVASMAYADDPAQPAVNKKITITEKIEIAPGEVAYVIVATEGKKVIFDSRTPGLTRVKPELINNTKIAVYSGASPGKYEVWAWSAIGEEPTEQVRCEITIKGKGPAPKPPEPKPVPPEPKPLPVDPLVKKMQDAYDKSPGAALAKEKQKVALIGTYLAMADFAKRPDSMVSTTFGLFEKMTETVSEMLNPDHTLTPAEVSTILREVRTVVAGELGRVFGAVDQPLTAEMRTTAYNAYTTLAAALRQVK